MARTFGSFSNSRFPPSRPGKWGVFLVTETMSHRHELSMESYDRLFPNQDTMPKGGFGNLIALPLQYEPRQHGNTVFLDQELNPIPDQWGYLSSIKRITSEQVEAIAKEASRNVKVTGSGLRNKAMTRILYPGTAPFRKERVRKDFRSGSHRNQGHRCTKVVC